MKATPKSQRLTRWFQTLWKTIEAAIFALPGLVLNALLNPGPPLTAVKFLLLGLAWLWIGDFLIKHSKLLRFILQVIEDFTKLADIAFGLTVDTIEVCIDAVITVANGAGSAVNFIGGLFGDSHIVPSIPLIAITHFTLIDFSKFTAAIDQLGNASETCTPFNDVLFEFAYPIRSALNIHICPIVRYTFSSIVYSSFDWLTSFMHFGADPNENNCQEPLAWIICFWLKFGLILVYLMAPLQVFYWLLNPLKRLLLAGIEFATISLRLIFSFFSNFLHTFFHKRERKKGQ